MKLVIIFLTFSLLIPLPIVDAQKLELQNNLNLSDSATVSKTPSLEELTERVTEIEKEFDKIKELNSEEIKPYLEFIGKVLDFIGKIIEIRGETDVEIPSLAIGIVSLEHTNDPKIVEQKIEEIFSKINEKLDNIEKDDTVGTEILEAITDKKYGLEEIKNEVKFIEEKIKEMTETKTSPKILKVQDSMTALAHIPFDPTPVLSIELYNTGNADANLSYDEQLQLTLKDDSSFTMLESSLNLNVKDNPKVIEQNKIEIISWNVSDNRFGEGTYSGRVFLEGNFDIIPVDVTVTYVVSPWFMVIMSLVGVGLAMMMGIILRIFEAEKKVFTAYKNSFLIFVHLIEHIVEINQMRNHIDPNKWIKMKPKAEEHMGEIIQKIIDGKLDPEFESIVWIEKFSESVQKEYFENAKVDEKNTEIKTGNIMSIIKTMINNEDDKINKEILEEILKHVEKSTNSKGDSPLSIINNKTSRRVFDEAFQFKEKSMENIMEKTTTRTKKEIKGLKIKELSGRDYNKFNVIFASITVIFSSFTTIFAVDSFVGPLWMHIIMAIGIGFGVYRTKDLKKVIEGKE